MNTTPSTPSVKELVAVTQDIALARHLAEAHNAWWCHDDRPEATTLPFKALVRWPDDGSPLSAGVENCLGVYRVTAREIKPGNMAFVSLHPMIRNPALTHSQADEHWHLRHGPLALVHHPHMSQYVQLAVNEMLFGPAFDGFALCGFATLEDLKTRFFAGPDSVRVINEDVARFADTRRSPRRLVAVVGSHG
jgi:hypothetical protein